MTTPDWLQASEDRVKRAESRLIWQRRLLTRAQNPDARRVAERMVVTLEEIVETLKTAHELLVRRSRQARGEPGDPGPGT